MYLGMKNRKIDIPWTGFGCRRSKANYTLQVGFWGESTTYQVMPMRNEEGRWLKSNALWEGTYTEGKNDYMT